MKQYFRIDYTDHEWFELMKKHDEKLPENYHDCFDEHGEYVEEYYDIFTTDIYKTKEKTMILIIERVIDILSSDEFGFFIIALVVLGLIAQIIIAVIS